MIWNGKNEGFDATCYSPGVETVPKKTAPPRGRGAVDLTPEGRRMGHANEPEATLPRASVYVKPEKDGHGKHPEN